MPHEVTYIMDNSTFDCGLKLKENYVDDWHFVLVFVHICILKECGMVVREGKEDGGGMMRGAY